MNEALAGLQFPVSVTVVAFDTCFPVEYHAAGTLYADGGVLIQYPFLPADGQDGDEDPEDPSAAAIDISYIVLPDGKEVMRSDGIWHEVAEPPAA
ncbi:MULTISPECIES: hypothetical protein [Ralstonia]|jgi:hypothetical protein|uniref:Uncharacterized protein n=2 Tax=Ralstonia pickettii TaxID=329 RepID=R0CMM7_RALPI|nr:hypothetical protein [Ralstonia pickettii]ENZ77705.1 hypothetical protein OR214_01981 [Ralstonia pickettii OR214]MCM3583894.1 hypothetical protein [Ralstonia pickettii]